MKQDQKLQLKDFRKFSEDTRIVATYRNISVFRDDDDDYIVVENHPVDGELPKEHAATVLYISNDIGEATHEAANYDKAACLTE